MLKVTTVRGNIFHDKTSESLLKDNLEKLKISRLELERTRLRRKTDRGTDIGLVLEDGTTLHHGDILKENGKTILVEQNPEKVISLRIKGDTRSQELLVLIGHIIGNRHRPISISDGAISFPIQADSELQVFEKLFAEILDQIELSIQEEIFIPHTGANVHDHG